ncbi:hypothetical protein VUR80DRAFT_9711 [Thermomyces stellatus]
MRMDSQRRDGTVTEDAGVAKLGAAFLLSAKICTSARHFLPPMIIGGPPKAVAERNLSWRHKPDPAAGSSSSTLAVEIKGVLGVVPRNITHRDRWRLGLSDNNVGRQRGFLQDAGRGDAATSLPASFAEYLHRQPPRDTERGGGALESFHGSAETLCLGSGRTNSRLACSVDLALRPAQSQYRMNEGGGNNMKRELGHDIVWHPFITRHSSILRLDMLGEVGRVGIMKMKL